MSIPSPSTADPSSSVTRDVEASDRKVVFLPRAFGRRRERRAGDAEEARIAAALAARDPEAITAVSQRFGRFLGGFLADTLPDRGSAEEVLQQVLVEIWRRGPEYDPSRASLLTWMMTIARSRAIDERRRRRPEPISPDLVTGAVEEPTTIETDQLLERWRVAELLDRIPREEAMMLRLRFYEGLAQPEIAARMGMKLGTVKSRMVGALARLRDLIEEEEGR
jgi:RNA polymerase sigma-70 factor (ECF subfamily)